MNAKSLEQRLLRLEFLVSTLMADRDQLMEYVNAERVKSTTEDDASNRARLQAEGRQRTIEESRTGLREG